MKLFSVSSVNGSKTIKDESRTTFLCILLTALAAVAIGFIAYPLGAQANGCPVTQCVGLNCTVTQSLDTVTNDDNSVACGAGGNTTENGWARCYNLAAEGLPPDFTVNSLTFGVQQAGIDGIQIDVVIYADVDGCPPSIAGTDAVELARETVIVNIADVGTFITVPFPGGVQIPAGTDMLVEIEQVEDGTVEPLFSFRPISNDEGQCESNYLRAAQCGITGWIALEDLGFPDMHLIQIVEGTSEIDIDLKPGSNPNCVNTTKKKGRTPVGIYGSDVFDVQDIDVTTLAFSAGSTAPIKCKVEDLESEISTGVFASDGFLDLICHFATEDIVWPATGSDCGAVGLTGLLLDGTPFGGADLMCHAGENTCDVGDPVPLP